MPTAYYSSNKHRLAKVIQSNEVTVLYFSPPLHSSFVVSICIRIYVYINHFLSAHTRVYMLNGRPTRSNSNCSKTTTCHTEL